MRTHTAIHARSTTSAPVVRPAVLQHAIVCARCQSAQCAAASASTRTASSRLSLLSNQAPELARQQRNHVGHDAARQEGLRPVRCEAIMRRHQPSPRGLRIASKPEFCAATTIIHNQCCTVHGAQGVYQGHAHVRCDAVAHANAGSNPRDPCGDESSWGQPCLCLVTRLIGQSTDARRANQRLRPRCTTRWHCPHPISPLRNGASLAACARAARVARRCPSCAQLM